VAVLGVRAYEFILNQRVYYAFCQREIKAGVKENRSTQGFEKIPKHFDDSLLFLVVQLIDVFVKVFPLILQLFDLFESLARLKQEEVVQVKVKTDQGEGVVANYTLLLES